MFKITSCLFSQLHESRLLNSPRPVPLRPMLKTAAFAANSCPIPTRKELLSQIYCSNIAVAGVVGQVRHRTKISLMDVEDLN